MTTLKKTVLVALMLGTLTSYAKGVINLKADQKEKITKVALIDVKKGHQLYIKDSQNQILYKEILKKSGTFIKRFDFTILNDGEYYLEIEKDFEIIKTPFSVKKGTAVFKRKEEVKNFKPVIRLKEGKILISKLSFKNTTLSIQIFYNENEIHSEKIKGTSIINQVYKLNRSYKGDYTVFVTTEKRTYKNRFTL